MKYNFPLIQKIIRYFKDDKKEIGLLILFFISLIAAGAVVSLRSESIISFVQSIAINIVAAYIFYIFIDVIPRTRNKSQVIKVLNTYIMSVVEGFLGGNPFQHEKSIAYVELGTGLESCKIHEYIEKLRNYDIRLLNVKFSAETADSRFSDFKYLLTLAFSISPAHALRWLILTDKIRLLSEESCKIPKNISPEELRDLDRVMRNNPNKPPFEMTKGELWYTSLVSRNIEFFEEVVEWNKLL